MNSTTIIKFDLADAEICYYPWFYGAEESDVLFTRLLAETPWQQDEIKIFGKTFPQPRLTALFGDFGKAYSYSNIQMQPLKWSPLLLEIKNKVEIACGQQFTTVLLNLYRDGRDSNGWHADDEKELGDNPVIASLSFGASRFFHLKHNANTSARAKIQLENGSLLVMRGGTQHYYKHQIPKTAKPVGARINLTFRTIS